jgi:hypothetical protein
VKAVVRGAFAIFIALLLVIESAGVARALGEGSMVECCCGSHSIARACKCSHCPIRLRHDGHREHARIDAPSPCVAHAHDGLLVVTATLPSSPALATPSCLPASAPDVAPVPRSVTLDPARPPP